MDFFQHYLEEKFVIRFWTNETFIFLFMVCCFRGHNYLLNLLGLLSNRSIVLATGFLEI